MGRTPCCDQDAGVKKGPWTPEEDALLVNYINENGHGSWRRLPKLAGLNRCGKSCRLRWTNYLRPDIKRGRFTDEEEKLIIHLHSLLGNKWSSIATKLPGRTDNEIKNYWNTHLRKKLLSMGIDPVTHQRRTDLSLLAGGGLTNLLAAANLAAAAGGHGGAPAGGPLAAAAHASWDINALRLQADAAKYQLLEGLVRVLTAPAAPTVDLMTLLAAANGGAAVSGHHLAAGVDHQSTTTTASRAVQQYDGMLSLPALTSVPVVTQGMSSSMSSAYSLSGLLNSFGGAGTTTNALAGDGLSSTEHGHSGATTGSNITAAAAMPPPLAPAAEGCNAGNGGGGTSSTPSPCEETPASSPFDGLDSLTMDFDPNSDSWRELLEQMSWLNNPNDQL